MMQHDLRLIYEMHESVTIPLYHYYSSACLFVIVFADVHNTLPLFARSKIEGRLSLETPASLHELTHR
jgi:hypothetical protein